MAMIDGIVVSQDEYDERVKEALARLDFAWAGMAGQLGRFVQVTEATCAIMQRFGAEMATDMRQQEAALGADDRERYDALRSYGVLPLDAFAALRADPDEIASLLDDIDDE